MLTHSMKKVVLGLGLAAVLFAGGTAMANERGSAPRPKNSPYSYLNYKDDSTGLIDAINRDHPVAYPRQYYNQ